MSALNIGQGPYIVKYNGVEVQGIDTVTPTISEDTTDIDFISGQKVTITKSHSATVVLSFVDTSLDNLQNIVPGAYLAPGTAIEGQAAGNVVGAQGAIAIGGSGSGGDITLTGPLEIIPATDAEDHALVLFDGVATITNFSITDQVLKVEVTVQSQATGVQMLKGSYTLVS